jgi:hypothetical protein
MLRTEDSVDRKVVVVARMVGRCAHCDGVVEIGQRIEKSLAGWMHEDCPADPPDDFEFPDPDVGDR